MRRMSTLLASLVAIGTLTGGLIIQPTGAGASGSSGMATVKIGSKTYKLSGATCFISGSKILATFGSPNKSIGINGKLHHGKFTNVSIAGLINGNGVGVFKDSGTASPKGGTFKGTEPVTGVKVSGKFTC
jgi:hypothetical protein